MTHDELLAKIDEAYGVISYAESGGLEDLGLKDYLDALRAVVALHRPDEDNEYCVYDSPEWDIVPYPCATIQAIEKELG